MIVSVNPATKEGLNENKRKKTEAGKKRMMNTPYLFFFIFSLVMNILGLIYFFAFSVCYLIRVISE